MGNEPSWAKGRTRPPPWKSAEGRTRFENPWLEVVEYEATAPTGKPAAYAVVRFRKLAVGVLPVHEDGTVTLVGQQRFALMNYSWEMPEGGVDPGENPLEAARRELREEVGLEARDWRPILEIELSNSVTDERAFVWLARDMVQGDTAPDETEVLDIVRVPFRGLLAAVAAGQVRDSMTVAATLRTYHMAREGELPAGLARAMLGDPSVID